MSDRTPRFALPLLQAGQAQKEIDHNEALATIDAGLNPAVTALDLAAPPADPDVGQAWVVGASPSGAWAGRAGAVAFWTAGGWRFLAPFPGLAVWNLAAGRTARWEGTGWRDGEIVASTVLIDGVQVVGARRAAIAAPTGGAVADNESRAAISAILAALRDHGLIAT